MESNQLLVWPVWRKVVFRFFFIYFLLTTTPWTWLEQIPGFKILSVPYDAFNDWLVNFFNDYILHIKEVLVPMGGSGDTSFGWAQFYTYLIIAFIGCIIWSVIDRKRKQYFNLNFALRTVLRYYLIMFAFIYGVIKLYALQMPFPSLSQLATPLGDLLPMRFSWLFIGYSFGYQFFSGLMEVTVGLLLLNRRTVLLGSLLGIGVFTNVFLLNIFYDIPVKIFSFQLLVACIYLSAHSYNRILRVFVFNKPVDKDLSWEYQYTKKWHKPTRLIAKTLFIGVFCLYPIYQYKGFADSRKAISDVKPFTSGVYQFNNFILNGDTIPPNVTSQIHWKDIIFDKGGRGSINSNNSLFRELYGRGYFSFKVDSTNNTIDLTTNTAGIDTVYQAKYSQINDKKFILKGKMRNDSLVMEIERTNRHFQLTERQFHWMSESNR